MHVAKDIAVARPLEPVWDFLWDVDRVAGCLPGCQDARAVVPHAHYVASIRERVGPFKVHFPLDIRVLEVEERHRLKAHVTGRDSAVGSSLRVVLEVRLEARDGGCVIHIASDATILGKLGTLGQGIIQRKADQVMSGFAAAIQRALDTGVRTGE